MIIAEIAQAHDGSLGILHSYIDALADAGVDAVKFQTHIAEAESSAYEPFRINFSYVDKTRYDYWQRMEFTLEQWQGIKTHCEQRKVEFISSPFSVKAVELLETLGVARYKIGSGEVSNLLMLNRIAQTGREVILSSGMSDLEELDRSIGFLQSKGTKVSLLQCTTAYPTMAEEWGLNVIPFFRERYNIPIGFSDHSGTVAACIAATALGAELLEFHAVFDRRMFGPDARASLEINEVASLVDHVRTVRKALSVPAQKAGTERFTEIKRMFGKSLAVNKELERGHILTLGDLEAKKPFGRGIDPVLFEKIIGRRLNKPVAQWSFLTEDLLEA